MTDRYTYKIFGKSGIGLLFTFKPDKDPKIEWVEGEEPEKFFKRKKIGAVTFSKEFPNDDGTLNFSNGLLFNYLWIRYFDASYHSTEYKLTVTDEVKSENVYEGYFAVKDLSFGLEANTFTIKPNLDDKYRWILAVEDEDMDIILENPTTLDVYTAEYEYETHTQSEAGTLVCPPQIPPLRTGATPPYACTDYLWVRGAGAGNTTWYRQVSQYEISGWTQYGSYWYKDDEDSTTIDMSFPNCHRLIPKANRPPSEETTGRGVIQYMLDELLPDTSTASGRPTGHNLTFYSLFFNTHGNGATNYVDGRANTLHNTLIEQKSDAKDPDATNKATKGVSSWEEMMKRLNNMFNVRWYIDDIILPDDSETTECLCIEHIKYLKNGLQVSGTPATCVDLTQVSKYTNEESGLPYYEDTQNFVWDSLERPIKETWSFMEEDTYGFRKDMNFIKYSDVVATSALTKSRTIDMITTDLTYIYNRPDYIGDDGFVLINCQELTVDTGQIIAPQVYTVDPTGGAWTLYLLNGYFGQTYLISDYWYDDRPYIEGHVSLSRGGIPTIITFDTAEKQLIQKEIAFLLNDSDTFDIQKYLCNYRYEFSNTGTDPNGQFTQTKDCGEIKKAELDLATGYYTVDVAYGIY